MAEQRLSLLGGFEVSGGLGALDLTRKGRGLLAFLALHRESPQSRDRIADMFWSRSDQEQARTSVRQTLSKLRRALLSAHLGEILTDRDLVSLRLDGTILDVERFRRHLERGGLDDLEQAVLLYRGDLLEGIGLEEEPFEEWLRGEREALRLMAIEALDRLCGEYLAAGEFGKCVATGTRLLCLDPLREDIHRMLMRAFAAQGRTGQALKQFELCRETLLEHLGVQPERETLALFRKLRDERIAGKLAADGESGSGGADLAAAADFPEVTSTSWHDGELTIADKPTVVILPFDSVTGESAVSYLSVGVTENIITGLSKFKELLVVAMKSSIVAGNAGASIQDLGRYLGVTHVVEGTVARLGDRVRVTARLIDVATVRQVWAERYDRMLGDMFAVQDDITQMIVVGVVGQIEKANCARVLRKEVRDMEAYDFLLRARHSLRTYGWSRKGEFAARKDLERVIALDNECSDAHAFFALSCIHEFESPWSDNAQAAIKNAFEFAGRAVALDPDSCLAHRVMAYAAHYRDEPDLAELEIGRAQLLNPHDYSSLCTGAWIYSFSDRQELALRAIAVAKRLNPVATENCLFNLGIAYHTSDRFQEAIDTFNRMRSWDTVRFAMLAAAHAMLGDRERAGDFAHKLSDAISKEFAGDAAHATASWKEYVTGIFRFRETSARDRFWSGIRLAGIPA